MRCHASSHNIKSFVFCTRMHAKRLLKYMMMITLNTQNTTDCLIHWYILCIGSVSLLCIFWLFFVACIIQDVVQQIFAFYLPPSVLIQYFPLLLHHYYDFDFMCCVCVLMPSQYNISKYAVFLLNWKILCCWIFFRKTKLAVENFRSCACKCLSCGFKPNCYWKNDGLNYLLCV